MPTLDPIKSGRLIWIGKIYVLQYGDGDAPGRRAFKKYINQKMYCFWWTAASTTFAKTTFALPD